MRLHRKTKNEDDREYLVEKKSGHDYSKIRLWAWKFAKGTWKALKIGFQTTASSPSFCTSLEPTAVATTIVEYQTRKRDFRQ